MRIMADENIPEQSIPMLRASGHDVLWVREGQPSAPDPDVLDWATRESRLLITLDKDFGDLSQRAGQPAPFGIILFRIADSVLGDERASLITQNVNAPVEWSSYLWVINIRKRRALG